MKTEEQLLEAMIALQRHKLLELGRALIPSLTADDILQPNDFPLLEESALFRYEEGVLHGLLAALAALRAPPVNA
jgi:hypothetical protein